MEKKHLLSKPLKLLKNERWRPYVRYEKKTDTFIAKAIKENGTRRERGDKAMHKIPSKIKVIMDRKELDIVARIVAYLYHDKKDDFKEVASELRQEHIYKDLRSIDEWLNIQYNRLEKQENSNKKLDKLDLEVLNEQSK